MPRLVDGLEQVFTDLGIIGAGYKLFFFETNTTTPKNTFSDVGLTIANPNPVVCDSTGRPEHDIWGDDPATYKMILGTPDSVVGNINPIVTVDPINDLNSGSIIIIDPLPAAYWGVTSGGPTTYTLNPALVPITSYSFKQCFFINFNVACNANPTININGLGAVNLKKYNTAGIKVSLAAGDIVAQRYIAINDGVDIVILNTPAAIVGQVITYAASTPPAGYLECNGAAISRTTYANLFSVIGTTFGVGNGTTTFNIPDVRGYFVRGWDNGVGRDPGRVFGTTQGDCFQGHYHSPLSGGTFVMGSGGSIFTGVGVSSGAATTGNPVTGTNGIPRFESETRPVNLTLLYCIKF